MWKKRLAEYEMPPMDDAIAEELTEFVDRRKQELPDEFA
ncbi:MAG: trimethylamine methyltransferase family protein [Ilumatobacteraceae bacterium]